MRISTTRQQVPIQDKQTQEETQDNAKQPYININFVLHKQNPECYLTIFVLKDEQVTEKPMARTNKKHNRKDN